jgi:hypothetical protein
MDQESKRHDGTTGEPQTSVMAVGSTVAGVLGLSLLPALGSIIALGLGYAARREVHDNKGMRGERLATLVIALGWMGVGLALVGVCMALWAVLLGLAAIPGLTMCRGLSGGF